MLADIEQQHAGRHGALARRVHVIACAADLVRSGLTERWHPTWVDQRLPSIGERGVKKMLGGWKRDLSLAARALRRAPGFTAVVVITLGLAIGVNTGIFSVVDAVLLEPLPYDEPDRLVFIAASAPESDFPEEFGVANEFLPQYQEATLLEDVALYNWFTATLRVDERVERVPMSLPSHSLFSTLQVSPVLGRIPDPDEENVALISNTMWLNWFGGDPNVIGRAYEMAGETRTIVGVMGPDFAFPDQRVLLWMPYTIPVEEITPGRFGRAMIGRMAAGTDIDAVVSELAPLAARLPERFGGSPNYAQFIAQHRPVVRPLTEEIRGSLAGPLWVLLGAVGAVLLIACANVANLLLVRAEGRQRDLAVRKAMGAGRRDLVRTQMAEAVLLAGLAGTVALVVSAVGVPSLILAAPANTPGLDNAKLDAMSFVFTVAATMLTALLCGLGPALKSSLPNLNRLRDGRRGSTGARSWTRDGLVVFQTALALVLLVGSGLLLRSFSELRNVDPGYDVDDVFTFQFAADQPHLNDAASVAQFHIDFMERLSALPGVESVGVVGELPLDESTRSTRFALEGQDVENGSLMEYTATGGDYFGAMNIALLRGRTFTQEEHLANLSNAIVSEGAAETFWPGEDPIGKRFVNPNGNLLVTVVGVVEDIKQSNFRDAARPMIYFPLVSEGPNLGPIGTPGYVVKTARAETIAPEVRALIREVAPEAPMYAVHTLESLAEESMVRLSFTTLTLGVASALALILGAVGLYGVLSYVVAQRTREIGVRMALGARAEEVQRMVVLQGAKVVAVGIVTGALMAAGAARTLERLLYGVEGTDAITYLATGFIMLAVGILASYLPARRASVVNPVEALGAE